MSKNTDHVLKRCRALGIEPGYLGYSKKSRRNTSKTNRKISEYGLQLREKQKTKFIYGVQERQFRRYFEMASNKKGVTGTILLQTLESRLDNVIYRLGLGTTRKQARVLVSHGNFEVNGRKVNIASYLVKPGDVITVRESKRENPVIKNSLEAGNAIPKWLEFDKEKLSAKVLRTVERDEIDLPVEEHLIVELYSK